MRFFGVGDDTWSQPPNEHSHAEAKSGTQHAAPGSYFLQYPDPVRSTSEPIPSGPSPSQPTTMSAAPGGVIDKEYQHFIRGFAAQLQTEIVNIEAAKETLTRPPGKDAPSACTREQSESRLRRHEWNLENKTRFQQHFADWDNFMHYWDRCCRAPRWDIYVERAKADELYNYDRPVQSLKSCFKRRSHKSLWFADSTQDPDPARQRAFTARHREPSPHLPAVRRQLRALRAGEGGARVTVEGNDDSGATPAERHTSPKRPHTHRQAI